MQTVSAWGNHCDVKKEVHTKYNSAILKVHLRKYNCKCKYIILVFNK